MDNYLGLQELQYLVPYITIIQWKLATTWRYILNSGGAANDRKGGGGCNLRMLSGTYIVNSFTIVVMLPVIT